MICMWSKVKKLNSIAFHAYTSELRGVTCHLGSHSVTSHVTQVNTPRPNPSHTDQHRHMGQFFLGGLSHLRPKFFLAAPEKNYYANLQNYFARLTPPSNN